MASYQAASTVSCPEKNLYEGSVTRMLLPEEHVGGGADRVPASGRGGPWQAGMRERIRPLPSVPV